MDLSLKVEMKQWGVGHGGFHTAEVTCRSSEQTETVRYIFDCGSKAFTVALRPQIRAYVQELKDSKVSKIDVLYLSHFDYDHVNGLKDLSTELDKDIQIEKVVVPFLSPIEKIMFISTRKHQVPKSYFDLVLSPEKKLRELFPDVEVVILKAEVLDELSSDRTGAPGSLRIESNAQGITNRTALWEVLPYVQPKVPKAADAFLRKLEGLMSDLLQAMDPGQLLEFVKKHRTSLRDAAKQVLGTDGSNASSIVLYSGPVEDLVTDCFIRKGRARIGWNRLPSSAARWLDGSTEVGGWLSTGDARLESKSAVHMLETSLGKARANRVTVIAAPHHGSEFNSGFDLWQAFPNARFVTAHAKGNKHHPSQIVREQIEKVDGKLFVVSTPKDDISMQCWNS